MALASKTGLPDVEWIGRGSRSFRGMVHVVEDVASSHGEPFKWGWVLTVCMILAMILELDHVNHDVTVEEFEAKLSKDEPAK